MTFNCRQPRPAGYPQTLPRLELPTFAVLWSDDYKPDVSPSLRGYRCAWRRLRGLKLVELEGCNLFLRLEWELKRFRSCVEPLLGSVTSTLEKRGWITVAYINAAQVTLELFLLLIWVSAINKPFWYGTVALPLTYTAESVLISDQTMRSRWRGRHRGIHYCFGEVKSNGVFSIWIQGKEISSSGDFEDPRNRKVVFGAKTLLQSVESWMLYQRKQLRSMVAKTPLWIRM